MTDDRRALAALLLLTQRMIRAHVQALLGGLVTTLVLTACNAPVAHAANNGTTVQNMEVDGQMRTYRLHVPPESAGGQPLPLVLGFHGYGGDGLAQEVISGMSASADRQGFVVAYPDGIDHQWHFGLSNIDDVAFVNALIDHLVQTLGVDSRHVYATGISEGGFFSVFLGCQPQTRMAAIAPVAASLTGLQALGCASAPVIPVMLTFGTADPIVPWAGSDQFPGKLLSVPATLGFWIGHSHVSAHPDVDEWLPDIAPGDGTQVHHLGYASGLVDLYAVAGGGHTWPGGVQYLPTWAVGKTNRDYSASDTILAFFSH